MKNKIITLAVTTFIAGTLITGCQSSSAKIENAEDKVVEAKQNVTEAKQELSQAIKDSIQLFKKESDDRISANEKSIAEFRMRIHRENVENRAIYEKNIAELERKNRDMRIRLEEFRDDGKESWMSFRAEFRHDMDELGKAFKGFTVKRK